MNNKFKSTSAFKDKSTIIDIKELKRSSNKGGIIDFQKERKKFTSFLKEIFYEPITTIKKVSVEPEKYLIIASVFFAILLLTTLVPSIAKLILEKNLVLNTLLSSTALSVVSVIVEILVVAGLIHRNDKFNNKFMNIISVVVLTKVPYILASTLVVFTIFSAKFATIFLGILNFANIISYILIYFAIKFLYNENDHDNVIKSFAFIFGVKFLISLVISFFGIGI